MEGNMKLTFLGTSHGVPEHHRFCSCTMITVGEKNYIIDAGAPVVDLLRRRGLTTEDITAIFITHGHGDHIDGLPQFLDLATWYFRETTTEIYLPTQKVIDALYTWNATVNSKVATESTKCRLLLYTAGVIYDDGNLKVTAIATTHCPGSHAFLLEGDGKTVIYTGDLGPVDKDAPKLHVAEHFDAMVCESAHFAITNMEPLIEGWDIDNLIINHTVPHLEPVNEEFIKAKERRYKTYQSFDGMEFEV